MRIVGKIFLGIVFTLFFIVLVLLATIKFEVLNKSFLFGSFEKHNVYTKLPPLVADSLSNNPDFSETERVTYSEFANNISPKAVKPLVEDNLTQVLDYLNGQSKNIVVSFSLEGIGFENASSIHWSPSQIPDKDLQGKITALNGVGNLLTISGLIILAILIGLLFISDKTILLFDGILIAVISLVCKLFLLAMSKEFVNSQELPQKLLGLLSSSLFSDITTTWLIAGGALVLLWLGIGIRKQIA